MVIKMCTKNITSCNGLELQPKTWKGNNIIFNTNCYIYALNLPQNPYTGKGYLTWDHVQPGNLGGNNQFGQLRGPFQKNTFIERVKKDLEVIGMEIVESTYDEVRKGKWWKVALAFENSLYFNDYHWWRQNLDGTWSHKPGKNRVQNTDNSDNIITNPETCNRGNYSTFAGFFMIRKKPGRKKKAFKKAQFEQNKIYNLRFS